MRPSQSQSPPRLVRTRPAVPAQSQHLPTVSARWLEAATRRPRTSHPPPLTGSPSTTSPLGFLITITSWAWKVMISTGPCSIILPIANCRGSRQGGWDSESGLAPSLMLAYGWWEDPISQGAAPAPEEPLGAARPPVGVTHGTLPNMSQSLNS